MLWKMRVENLTSPMFLVMRNRVQARVIDEGQVTIKPGEIVITTPPGISPDMAVQRPEV